MKRTILCGVVLMVNLTPNTICGEGYSIERKAFSKKLKPVAGSILLGYVKEFLDHNAAAKKHLPSATNQTLWEWTHGLEQEVEKRYIYCPSSAVNRRKVHKAKILQILQEYRKNAQDLALEVPLHLTETPPALPISLSMRLLLNENQQRNILLGRIKDLLHDHGGEATRREETMHLLLQYMQQNEDYRRNIREFFFGYPDEKFLQTLKAKGQVFLESSRKENPSPDFLGALLYHCQILQSINNRMINNLQSLFLYPPEGMPVKDSDLTQTYVLIKNTVENIEEKGSKLSEKNKLIFDQLCRITALILWIDWVQDLKNMIGSAPVDSAVPQNNTRADLARISEHIKKDWLELMTNKACTGNQLKQWFSVVKSGCILPKTLVQKWLEELLELLKVVEHGFSMPKFYYALSDRLPNLIEKLSQQLAVLLDTGSTQQDVPLAPAALETSTDPLTQKE